MIQRIQSVYLFLASMVSAGLIFVINLWIVSSKKIFAFDLFSNKNSLDDFIPVLFFVSALLSIVTVFLFKNRKLQIVISRVNILINLFLLGLIVYVSLNLPGEVNSEKGIGMFIPALVVLLLFLASRAIKKDEDLVKSVDRLR